MCGEKEITPDYDKILRFGSDGGIMSAKMDIKHN